jgi:L-threonylcarbamoyladenylate synthase
VGTDALDEAAATLRRGGLVAFPTETVYGLGADARDPRAVERVFAVKGRPADNPLIVHLADASWLPRVVREVTPLAQELAARFWPGPLTLVLDAVDGLPAITTGGHPTVGVRVPDHPVAQRLIELADLPVAAPSANRSGRPSPTTARHVVEDLGGDIDAVVDGGASIVGLESTVVDARGPRPIVLREGAVTREELAAPAGTGRAASPGSRYRHYAPTCRVLVTAPDEVADRCRDLTASGARVGAVVPAATAVPPGVTVVARVDGTPDLAARLYGTFRDAEGANLDVLVVSAVEEAGLGRAVMDRLRRAAS